MLMFGLVYAGTVGPPPGSPTSVSSCGTLSTGYYQLSSSLDADILVAGATCIYINESYINIKVHFHSNISILYNYYNRSIKDYFCFYCYYNFSLLSNWC